MNTEEKVQLLIARLETLIEKKYGEKIDEMLAEYEDDAVKILEELHLTRDEEENGHIHGVVLKLWSSTMAEIAAIMSIGAGEEKDDFIQDAELSWEEAREMVESTDDELLEDQPVSDFNIN